MPTEKKLRVFKIEDSGTVEEYSIRDSHINLAYGVCSTDEATTAKVVTLTNDPGWGLKSGSMISVKFLYPVSVASTLNVDGTGAKDIWQHGAAAVNVIRANDTVQLVYDGTRYSILAIDSASQLRAGEAGGLATLDASGKIPGSQLPSYVDDVLEFVNRDNFPATGEAGKIYVDTSSNESYRWSGSTYIRIDDVDEFVGATSSSAGSAGLVPAPASGDQHKFLGANGQWNDLDASMDIDISLPVNGWSATQPYTYTWLNSNVTDGCTVKVYFLTGSEEDDTLFLEFEKVAGGVQFTAPTMPTDPIPVRIHLIYFETGINDQQPTEADRISTDAIHGAANVEEALTTLDTNIKTKLDKPVNVPADRFLRTDANGQAVWAAAANSSEVADAVSDWLSDNITTGQTIALDESLTVAGAAGDAKATGDRLNAFADATTGIVAVSDTQPQSADNRLWINDSTVEEYSVPTYAEHEALSGEVTDLKDALQSVYIPLSFEIGVNRYIGNVGELILSSNTKRASTDAAEVPDSKILTITPAYGYTISLFKRINGAWSIAEGNRSTSFTANIAEAELYCIVASSNSDIPDTAVPCTVCYNIPSQIDGIPNEFKETLTFDIGMNRYLSGTQLVVSQNSKRATVAPFRIKLPKFKVTPIQDYKYTIYVSNDGTSWTALRNGESEPSVLTCQADAYVSFSFQRSNADGVIPSSAQPIRMEYVDFIDDYLSTKQKINAIDLIVSDINNKDLWEQGGIGSRGENYDTRATSIRTWEYLNAEKFSNVVNNSESSIYIAYYDSNKLFKSRVSYNSGANIQLGAISFAYFRVEILDAGGDTDEYS